MKNSNQLQREAEIHRQELSNSLDGLRTAATPSYVTSEVLNLAKDSSVSIAKALAEQARANPIPALLIGAGLVMMLTRTANANRGGYREPDLFDKTGSALKSAANAGMDVVRGAAGAVMGVANNAQRTAADTVQYAGDATSDAARRASDLASDTARRAGNFAHDTANRASDLASDAARRAGGFASETASRAGELMSDAARSAADAASGISQTAGSLAQNVRSTARDTLDKAGELGSTAIETARNAAGQVRDSVTSTTNGLVQQGRQTAHDLTDRAQQMSGTARNYVSTVAEEQPIVVAALGAAIGAAIGAALPMTAAERQYLGSTSVRVKQAGRDTISKVAEIVKSETVDDDLGAKVNAVTGKVISA